jgi:hypothetical protein
MTSISLVRNCNSTITRTGLPWVVSSLGFHGPEGAAHSRCTPNVVVELGRQKEGYGTGSLERELLK